MKLTIESVLCVAMMAGSLFGEPLRPLRSYTFTGGKGEVPNAGSETNAPARHLPEGELLCDAEGAVILDGDRYEMPPVASTQNVFSVALLVKPIARGRETGNGGSANGMLCASGNGYYEGWRLVLFDWQTHCPTLEIGRKEGAWGLRSEIPLSIGFWNLIAASWDGKTARLFINGIKAAEKAYTGPLIPSQAPFKIGFANSGVGSLKMAVRQVVFDDRAWSESEVNGLFARMERRNPAAVQNEARQAEALLRMAMPERIARCVKLLDTPPRETPYLFGMAVEQLRLLAERGEALPSAVLTRLPELLELDADTQSRYGLALTEALIRENKTEQAITILEQMLTFAGTLPAERAPVLQRYAELLTRCGKCDKARQIYASLRDNTGLSLDVRTLAALSLAHTYLREANYADAITAYNQVLAANAHALKPHLRFEAQRCITRCERLQAGLPPDDPAEERKPPAPLPKPAVTFFVAPNGDDRADGSIAHPFATLARARDAVNAKKSRGLLPPGGAAVYLRGGRYAVTNTFTLTTADSGTVNAPIVYRAWRDEKPILDGGFPLKGLRKVSDPAILARLPEEARGHVYVADLVEQGFGPLVPRKSYGYGKEGNRAICELYEDGKPLTLARWPNAENLETGTVIDPTNLVFTCTEKRLARWADAREVMASGYWYYLWAGCTVPVTRLDPIEQRVTLGEKPSYGIQAKRPYYFLNLLEEIDQPGEWFLDHQTGKLYLWPQRWALLGKRVVSRLRVPFIRAEGVREVVFDGLTLEYGQQDGMVLDSCANLTVSGCVIRRLGGTALIVTKGAGLHIYGNLIHTLGHTGMRVGGGDRRSLTSGRITIENNDVGFFGRHARTYNPALLLEGCGARVAHNHFHDAPSSAMRIEGNDHLITFNHVERVVQESDDQGGIDMWCNLSYRGVVIRYNRWNDIGGGPAPCGQAGIRFDDAISGMVVYGNRFERTSNGNFGGVQIHGGHHNIIDNNLFTDCRYGVSFSPWGQKRWTEFTKTHTDDIHKTVNIRLPPYSTRYPELVHIGKHADINSIWRNTFIGVQTMLRNNPADTDLWANHMNPAGTDEAGLTVGAAFAPLPPLGSIGCYPDSRRARE